MVAKRRFVQVDDEPKWDGKNPLQIDVVNALNWYNQEKTDKDAAKYLNTTPSVARDFLTLAWIKRMMSRGLTIGPESLKTIKEMENKFNMVISGDEVESDKPSNVISIQDRIKSKTDEIIGEMEGLIDQYGIRGDHKQLNVYQWFIDNNVKAVHSNKIVEYFRERSKEAMDALSSSDGILKEYYSGYTKTRLMNLLQVYSSIITDAQKLIDNHSKERKPRKKKPVSFEKMSSKIKYLEKDDKLKLQSINPVKIIGAMQLWIFNTKTRKLGVYNGIAGGLKIKGTTILNYEESSSISKTLRKPEKTLELVTNGGKIALRKVLDSINSKSIKLNGRINKYTVLLRVS